MPGISKSNKTKFFECFYFSKGKHVMDNIVEINELVERSSLHYLIFNVNQPDDVDVSLNINMASSDDNQIADLTKELDQFANDKGKNIIEFVETFYIMKEIHVRLTQNFEKNLIECLQKCSSGKYREF
jgi:hypothetical protein